MPICVLFCQPVVNALAHTTVVAVNARALSPQARPLRYICGSFDYVRLIEIMWAFRHISPRNASKESPAFMAAIRISSYLHGDAYCNTACLFGIIWASSDDADFPLTNTFDTSNRFRPSGPIDSSWLTSFRLRFDSELDFNLNQVSPAVRLNAVHSNYIYIYLYIYMWFVIFASKTHNLSSMLWQRAHKINTH